MKAYNEATFLQALEDAGNSGLLLRVTKDFGSVKAYLDFLNEGGSVDDPAAPSDDEYRAALAAWQQRPTPRPATPSDDDTSTWSFRRSHDDSSPSAQSAEYEYVKRLLPGGDVSPLFESETCLLCKGDHPRPRSYYAITDMGHKEPEGKKTTALGFRVKTKVGSMVPLQIAACPHCRKVHMTAAYLKLVTIVAIMAAALLILTLQPVAKVLLSLHESFSLLIFLAMIPVSWAVGTTLNNRYIAKHSVETRFDIAEIPFVHRMIEMGWFPLYDSGKTSRLVFSKKRLSQGWFI